MKKLMDATGVVNLVSVLWPQFVEVGDHVFAKCAASRSALRRRRTPNPAWAGLDRTGIESLENHLHVLDLFGETAAVWNKRARAYRRRHPHFRAADAVGKIMATTWHAKLRLDLPRYRFRVYYTRDDDPVVRFHRVYENEPVWLDERRSERDIQRRAVLVFDTKRPASDRRRMLTSEATRF